MEYQFKTNGENSNITLYFTEGSFCEFAKSSKLHNHGYTEVQILLCGSIEYSISNKKTTLSTGGGIIIPKRWFHRTKTLEKDTVNVTFQISKYVSAPEFFKISDFECAYLKNAVEDFSKNGDSQRLSAILMFICENIGLLKLPEFETVYDRKFIIEDFLSQSFSDDAKLSELAKILCISEKQTARLVKKYTGNDFRHEISRRRVEAAKKLMTETDLSVEQIATAVGYKSYSSLWRALNKG